MADDVLASLARDVRDLAQASARPRRAPVAPRDETEAQWTAWVIELAVLCGWRVHHVRPARTGRGWRTAVQGHIGFPDLVLARAGDLVIAELKTRTGQLRPDQRTWLTHLGAHVVVWRPADRAAVRARLARPPRRDPGLGA